MNCAASVILRCCTLPSCLLVFIMVLPLASSQLSRLTHSQWDLLYPKPLPHLLILLSMFLQSGQEDRKARHQLVSGIDDCFYCQCLLTLSIQILPLLVPLLLLRLVLIILLI